MATETITLGALVSTDKGEGFVFGRSVSAHDMYDVRLFDGTLCSTYHNKQNRPIIKDIKLLDRKPIDHPKFPRGLRAVVERLA